jgi:hypothetical protein
MLSGASHGYPFMRCVTIDPIGITFDFVDRFGGGGIQLIARLIEQG